MSNPKGLGNEDHNKANFLHTDNLAQEFPEGTSLDPLNPSQYITVDPNKIDKGVAFKAFRSTQEESLNITSLQSITEDQVKEAKTALTTFEAAGTSMITGTAVASLSTLSNPATSTLAGFVKMLPYIRYIAIKYPPKLNEMLNNLNTTVVSFSFGFSIPSGFEAVFTKYPLPHNFDLYQFHSSFIVNFWQTMTCLAVILAAIILLSGIVHITKKIKILHEILKTLKTVIKWNFFLMVFCTNFDVVVLSTSLEFRTLNLDSVASVFSMLFCVFVNLVAAAILGLACYIVIDIRRQRRKTIPEKNKDKYVDPEKKWEEFQLFFKGSKDDQFIKHFFIFPFLLRIYIFNFIIAHLFDYPLAQIITITILNVLMILFIVVKKPFVSTLVFCQHVSDEIILLTVNICLLVMGVFDYHGEEKKETRQALGDIIIYANITFNITANFYLIAYLWVGFKAAYVNMKNKKKSGIISWLVALLAPFEAGGMDIDLSSPKEKKVFEKTPVNDEKMSVGSVECEVNNKAPTLRSVQRIPTLKSLQKLDLHFAGDTRTDDEDRNQNEIVLTQDTNRLLITNHSNRSLICARSETDIKLRQVVWKQQQKQLSLKHLDEEDASASEIGVYPEPPTNRNSKTPLPLKDGWFPMTMNKKK